MSTKFKSDLLITPDVFNRHDFNETMEVFVDKNRPTVVKPNFVDVMYDVGLSGGLEKKLYERLTSLLATSSTGNVPSVDLFFTNKGEYDTFIAIMFTRGTVRARADRPWAITRKVTTANGDEVTEVLSLSVQPFEHTDRGVNYYGVTVRLRDIAPSEASYSSWVYYLGGDFSTVLNQAQSYTGSYDTFSEEDPVDDEGLPKLPGDTLVTPERVIHEMDEENVETVKDALLHGDLSIVMSDEAAFAEVYSAIANKLHHPAGIEHDIEHYNVDQGSVDKFVFDKFTSFGKTYYVLKGYTEPQL